MKRFLLIAIVVLVNVNVFAQRRYDADFTQLKVMKASGKTQEKAGHLIFDGADHLIMEYSEPENEFFIIDGNIVKINMDGKNVELDAEKAKTVGMQRATLLNCLSGNWEQAVADNNAEVTVTEGSGIRVIYIDASGNKKVTKGGYLTITLTYRMDDDALLTMILEQKNGVVNTYNIKY